MFKHEVAATVGSSHYTIATAKISLKEGKEDTTSLTKLKEEYIKFNGNDEKKFCEWSI